jgi:hypothetical protein
MFHKNPTHPHKSPAMAQTMPRNTEIGAMPIPEGPAGCVCRVPPLLQKELERESRVAHLRSEVRRLDQESQRLRAAFACVRCRKAYKRNAEAKSAELEKAAQQQDALAHQTRHGFEFARAPEEAKARGMLREISKNHLAGFDSIADTWKPSGYVITLLWKELSAIVQDANARGLDARDFATRPIKERVSSFISHAINKATQKAGIRPNEIRIDFSKTTVASLRIRLMQIARYSEDHDLGGDPEFRIDGLTEEEACQKLPGYKELSEKWKSLADEVSDYLDMHKQANLIYNECRAGFQEWLEGEAKRKAAPELRAFMRSIWMTDAIGLALSAVGLGLGFGFEEPAGFAVSALGGLYALACGILGKPNFRPERIKERDMKPRILDWLSKRIENLDADCEVLRSEIEELEFRSQ